MGCTVDVSRELLLRELENLLWPFLFWLSSFGAGSLGRAPVGVIISAECVSLRTGAGVEVEIGDTEARVGAESKVEGAGVEGATVSEETGPVTVFAEVGVGGVKLAFAEDLVSLE